MHGWVTKPRTSSQESDIQWEMLSFNHNRVTTSCNVNTYFKTNQLSLCLNPTRLFLCLNISCHGFVIVTGLYTVSMTIKEW